MNENKVLQGKLSNQSGAYLITLALLLIDVLDCITIGGCVSGRHRIVEFATETIVDCVEGYLSSMSFVSTTKPKV